MAKEPGEVKCWNETFEVKCWNGTSYEPVVTTHPATARIAREVYFKSTIHGANWEAETKRTQEDKTLEGKLTFIYKFITVTINSFSLPNKNIILFISRMEEAHRKLEEP